MSDFQFLKRFFQSATDQPLEAGDPRYVPLYTEARKRAEAGEPPPGSAPD